MGDWYGTAALLLALGLFGAGVWVWENRARFLKSTPDQALPQLSGPTEELEEGLGRGSGRGLEDPLEEVGGDPLEDPWETSKGARPVEPQDWSTRELRPGFGAPEGVRGAWIKVARRERGYDDD